MRAFVVVFAIFFIAAPVGGSPSRTLLVPSVVQNPSWLHSKTPVVTSSGSLLQSPPPAARRPGQRPTTPSTLLVGVGFSAVLSALRRRSVSMVAGDPNVSGDSVHQRGGIAPIEASRFRRRAILLQGALAFASVFAAPCLAAAPAQKLSEAEMAARVARKAELLQNQGRLDKAGAEIAYDVAAALETTVGGLRSQVADLPELASDAYDTYEAAKAAELEKERREKSESTNPSSAAVPESSLLAAEPERAKKLTDEEMAARVARKAELLKKQGRRQAGTTLYNGDYQAGKRDSKPGGASGVAGFLLPNDVGGLNLQSPGAGSDSK